MGTIVLTVAKNNKKFISIACLNIVISANAGGAFSPFGDITTLMTIRYGLWNLWHYLYLVSLIG